MDESGRSGGSLASRGEEPTVALTAGASSRQSQEGATRPVTRANPTASAVLEATTTLATASTAAAMQPAAAGTENGADVVAQPQASESWAEWIWEQAGCTLLSAGLHIVVFIVLALTLGTITPIVKKTPIAVEVEEVSRA